MTVFTIGHSNRSFEQFAAILQSFGLRRVADVRSYRRSRRFPWFGEKALAAGLSALDIGYTPVPGLGGRRQGRPDSPNTVWNVDFRAYADHMETDDFEQGLEALLEMAAREPTAMMCAEARWQECHRMLVADLLRARGHTVVHLLAPNSSEPHPFSPGARADARVGGHYARSVLGLEGPVD